MLLFPGKTLHVLEALLYIALHHSTRPISGKQLSDKQGLPPRYLERTLQHCVHEGILRSIRGPRGGYVLARERRRITLAEIFRVLLAADVEVGPNGPQSLLTKEIILPLCEDAQHCLLEHLEQTTLANLCEMAYDNQLIELAEPPKKARAATRPDFMI